MILWIFLLLPLFSFALTIEEKVGQLLIVHFHGEEANEEASKLIKEAYVGGFIYYNWANGLHSPQQVRHLSESLQALASIPLFITVDQEGGRVNRLCQGFTHFPSNKIVSETMGPEEAKRIAFAIGSELKAVGVNVNLAPVVDIASNFATSTIGDRSFSSHPERVAIFGQKALEGYAEAGVLAVLKHFPGYGDVEVDPHADLPLLRKSKEDLDKVELYPYYHLAKIAPMIMTAHLLVPSLDPKNCATTSPFILEGLLKGKIGFKGLIISDSLVMQGLLNHCGDVKKAAIAAINAGCDLLILGGKQLLEHQSGYELSIENVVEIHDSLVQAVKTGEISEDRLNEAVEKILKMKEKL